MNKRPFDEVGVVLLDFKPLIDNTNTKAVWEEFAKENRLVKFTDQTSLSSRENGLQEVTFTTGTGDTPIGILKSVNGDPNTPGAGMVATVAIEAFDCNLDGNSNSNTAFAKGDLDGTSGFVPADGTGSNVANRGKATAKTAPTGTLPTAADPVWGMIVGGDQTNMRVAFKLYPIDRAIGLAQT